MTATARRSRSSPSVIPSSFCGAALVATEASAALVFGVPAAQRGDRPPAGSTLDGDG